MGLRDRLAALKAKASQDVQAADRARREKTSELKQKGKQDVKAAKRKVRETSTQDLAAAFSAAGEKLADDQGGADTRSKEVAQRAEQNAQARAPVDATIDPMSDPRQVEAMASATGGAGLGFGGGDGDGATMEDLVMGTTVDDSSDQADQDGSGAGMALSVSVGTFGLTDESEESVDDGDRGEKGPLDFDDPLGAGGDY